MSFVRIETKSKGRLKWAKMLAELKGQYGDQFRFYMLNDLSSTQVASVCVTNPHDDKTSMVEMMLSTQRLFGVDAADLAGTAIFINGNKSLAQSLRLKILELKKSKNSQALDTPSDILNSLAGSAFYFAYGSNMNSQQMVERCPSAEYINIGLLKNHEMVFNRQGSYRPGGVASVSEKDKFNVYGIVWKISLLDLKHLDEVEDLTAYKRNIETIYTKSGNQYKCYV